MEPRRGGISIVGHYAYVALGKFCAMIKRKGAKMTTKKTTVLQAEEAKTLKEFFEPSPGEAPGGE